MALRNPVGVVVGLAVAALSALIAGVLWFRDKSHDMSIEEITTLLSPDTDAIVIGTGRHGAVRVDPAVQGIEGVEVNILRTPEAFTRFNELKAQGRKVVLIAHSTC
jgi:hypothetical protein